MGHTTEINFPSSTKFYVMLCGKQEKQKYMHIKFLNTYTHEHLSGSYGVVMVMLRLYVWPKFLNKKKNYVGHKTKSV